MICYAARKRPFTPSLLLAALFVTGALLPSGAEAQKKRKGMSPEELLQPLLSPKYARWLIGPVAQMADKKEIQAYQLLTEDAEAEAFIEEFWRKREAEAESRSKTPREIFESRAEEADSQFTEGTRKGRHSDRGTIHILYGPPEEIDREVAPYAGGPPIEVWIYAKKGPKGLDGEKPTRQYRFIRDSNVTTFYYPGMRLDPRKRLERERAARRPF